MSGDFRWTRSTVWGTVRLRLRLHRCRGLQALQLASCWPLEDRRCFSGKSSTTLPPCYPVTLPYILSMHKHHPWDVSCFWKEKKKTREKKGIFTREFEEFVVFQALLSLFLLSHSKLSRLSNNQTINQLIHLPINRRTNRSYCSM